MTESGVGTLLLAAAVIGLFVVEAEILSSAQRRRRGKGKKAVPPLFDDHVKRVFPAGARRGEVAGGILHADRGSRFRGGRRGRNSAERSWSGSNGSITANEHMTLSAS